MIDFNKHRPDALTIAYIAVIRDKLERAHFKINRQNIVRVAEQCKKMLGDLPEHAAVFFNNDEKQFLKDIKRVVVGAHGPYIEFEESDLYFGLTLEVTKGQEWRIHDSRYLVKYHCLNPVGHPNVKIYKQIREVKYADYKVGMLYVDFCAFDVVPYEIS